MRIKARIIEHRLDTKRIVRRHRSPYGGPKACGMREISGMNTERRKYPRFTLDQMIELGFERERFVQAEGVNASESGILCRTYEQFEKYAKVFLMLSVPFAGKIVSVQCEGIVIRSDRVGEAWETGIDITDISSEGRQALKEYLKAGGGASVS